ncbi:hypothetical protein SEA_DELAGARZA_32 [Microbacterium phage DelaGarza]|nr:hypothetical protein SEA_DELAGARZA_32 [Microbacterium phage DelaGarza]
MTDDQTIADAAEAIRALNRRLSERDGPDYKASPEDLARAALSVIPDAILEEAPLVVVTLQRLSEDEAEFAATGGPRLVLHKGDWVERGRPVRLHLSMLDLEALRQTP